MTRRIPVFGATDDSDKFIDVYPDYDFACIARWAWAAMRAVDYLYTLPEVDREQNRNYRPFPQREAGAAGGGLRRTDRGGGGLQRHHR